ncbi:MAG: OmpA family protein [Candidatus Parabeggiatoa sp.]|nr:OmpA family protein [Candidatus Parabeggiatoa sp.]
MKNLQSFLVEDNNVFGPGTDLVVSLAAVLIILIAVNANSFHQQLAEQEKILISCQELKIKYGHCEETLAEQEKRIVNYQELKTKYQHCEIVVDKFSKIIAENDIGQVDIQEVKKNQMEIVNRIAAKYNRKPLEIAENIYGISIRWRKNPDIVIQNDVTIQRISFGSHILFDVDKTKLKENGKKVLTIVGNIFKGKLGAIQEIQIQGHADPQQSRNFSSNLELAAHRAIEVFKHFQELGIDPTRHIM